MASNSLSQTREICLPAIEKKLLSFLDQSSENGFSRSAEMARYQFSSGGKRLRALIPCWVYQACGKNPLDALQIGCAVEMIHNATLVHDDLQDGDTLRRGIPTVWKKYSEAQAINCGDAMFQFGLQLLLEMPLDAASLKRMSLKFLRSVTEVIEGQAQEFILKDEPLPTVDRYLRVVEGKTAALLASCFSLAADALGKSEAFCREVEMAGRDLGVLFQIQDDLLDVYGEKGRDRKATDIAEGKVSILIAQLVQDASTEDRDVALGILRKPREQTSDADIERVLELFEEYGIREKVLVRIQEIRSRTRNLSWQGENAPLKDLLVRLETLFLEPIQKLLT